MVDEVHRPCCCHGQVFRTEKANKNRKSPLGLNIPVVWRQPSYKGKRSLEYLKANFHIQFSFFLRDPVGIQTQDLQNRNLTLYSAKLRDQLVQSGCKSTQ